MSSHKNDGLASVRSVPISIIIRPQDGSFQLVQLFCQPFCYKAPFVNLLTRGIIAMRYGEVFQMESIKS